MGMWLTYAKAIEQAEALKALGQGRVYLSDTEDGNSIETYPWDKVTKVEGGSTHSYIGPRSVSFTAEHESGLVFYWSIDLAGENRMGSVEKRPFFDHSHIVAIADRLAEGPRAQLKAFLATDALPPLEKQITEARAHLNALLDGQVTMQGIIAGL